MTGLAQTIKAEGALAVSAHHRAYFADLSLCDDASRVHNYFRILHEVIYRNELRKDSK